jgi:hypothetical protein
MSLSLPSYEKTLLKQKNRLFFDRILTDGQKRGKITSNLIDYDGKSTVNIPFQESRRCWECGNGSCRKNAPESAEESRCQGRHGD